uniref:DUF6821 domain-containing protein n=1 Tax=Kalanchoe fedtschenkoi TaxID=63787 RepID=A0A7N0RCT2_KALFE
MEGGGGAADFNDWEMLQSDVEEEIREGGVAAESEGLRMLRLDYFSIDNSMEYAAIGGDKSDLSSEGGSVVSDNPSWVDPAASDAAVFRRRNSGEFWPDSASDRSKSSDSGDKVGLGLVESGDDHVLELKNQGGYLGKLGYDSGGYESMEVGFEGIQEVEKMGVASDLSVEKIDMEENPSAEIRNETVSGIMGGDSFVAAQEDGNLEKEVELPIVVEKKALMWWKLPLELVKFCVFRVSPLWSISVAAAMVGVFIMRRRLHMMKRKTKGLQMKVTVDHKKVDQFMSRAARLNEAFSVVRRVPIIRPPLPAPGVTPWPVMSMR